MIEYFILILQFTKAIILWATAYYIYSLIKVASEIVNDLLLEVSQDPPKLEVKRQKLIECVLIGNSEQYLGKAYTEEFDKLFSIYEATGESIIKMYSMGACAVLGMTNQDALSEDLESDPFLNSALIQRYTCEL